MTHVRRRTVTGRQAGEFGNAVFAGLVYFAIVFAAGFLIGSARVLFLLQLLDEALAVGIELPIMLVFSWLVSRWVVGRFEVPPFWRVRFLMGVVAFALLMLGEFTISVLGFGRSLSQHLALYQEPLQALGLAAQVLFALFPVMHDRRADPVLTDEVRTSVGRW